MLQPASKASTMRTFLTATTLALLCAWTAPAGAADDALLQRMTLCQDSWLDWKNDEVRLTRRLTWIVDPIDGTRNYLNGHDEWCVSVALVEDASPVLAAVFAPTSDEFFFAARGQGTTLNDAPVQATAGSELDFSRVAGPKPLVERLKPSLGEIKLHPRIGSLALRLCRVAHGALDAAFAGGNSHDWDLAAADLIVQEADGRMSDLSGDPILYNRRQVTHGVLVAAGRDRHASIVSHFRNRPLP
jgi:myo-inositol-1(or 4)-monophosphatase